jgi:DNA-binding transcriptional LysR family regulator
MHCIDDGALDLNLLVALRALLAERHVTRAAARIGLSQPAMSHALSRLRALLDDPVLVRTSRGMEPTARAQAIAAPLEQALADLERIVAPAIGFDPSRSRQTFRVATMDYVELVLLPSLLARLWAEAPSVDIRVKSLAGSGFQDLADGRVDIAIGPVFPGRTGQRGIFVQKLWSERFVCVVRADHPAVGKRLTLETFLNLPHALVAPRGESAGGVVDAALARIGKKRRIAIEVPHFLVAPHVVKSTDAVLTLAARVARELGPALGLRQLPPPPELSLSGFDVSLVWHERRRADAAQAWFRGVVASIAKSLAP